MSKDNSQEKSYQPSERKRREAKEQGQLLRSRDLNTWVVMLCGAVGLWFTAKIVSGDFIHFFKECLAIKAHTIGDPLMVVNVFYKGLTVFVKVLLPISILLVVATLIANFFVGGIQPTMQNLQIKWERLNLVTGFNRLFSVKSFVELGKSILKFLLVLSVALLYLKNNLPGIIHLGFDAQNIQDGFYFMFKSFLLFAASLILLAIIDVPIQWFWHMNKLKMTTQEVKDESKDQEGRPEIKQQQKAQAQQILKNKMLKEIPNADVIITNPNHYAVALKYDTTKGGAPVMIAKGVDFMAEKIKVLAKKHNVTQMRLPPLARSLFYHTKINEEIPEELYQAVAKVLAYVYQLKRFEKGQGEKPGHLSSIDIPSGWER